MSARERVAPLGATPDPTGTTFAVWSEAAEAVELCLLDGRDERRVPMTRDEPARWRVRVDGVGPGQEYGLRVHGPWDPWQGGRANPAKLLLDPYTRAVTGRLELHPAVFGHRTEAGPGGVPTGDDTVIDERDSAPYVPRGVVVDGAYDWGEDRPPAVPWSETVVYEAHVRGMTRLHPELPEELRGTYAGLAHPAVIGHLRDLGVTTLELLPVAQSASEPFLLARGQHNVWGYNPLALTAPHGAYSAAGDRGGQVREFRDMVRALHAAGIEVVLDVVLNHTCEGDETGPTLSWRGIDNRAYYRLWQGRRYVDYSGCGNALDLRMHRVLTMATDALRYWVEEMHVDGFRFDLASALARGDEGFDAHSGFLAAVGQDPVLSSVKLIAEPWDLAAGGYRLGGFPPPWAEWNDRFRDAGRRFWLADAHGTRTHGVRELASRLAGSSDVFQTRGRAPTSSVNFVTAHDGFTLHDLVSYEHKRNDDNGEDNRDGSDHNLGWGCGADGPTDDADVLALRRRMLRNLLSTVLLSTGVPMLTAGDESGRTQRGNNNAYCIDDETTWTSWLRSPWQEDLLAWTRALLRLRREHPVLRQGEFFDGRPAHEGGLADLGWFGPDGRQMDHGSWFDLGLSTLGMFLTGDWLEGDSSFLIVLNGGPAPVQFVLPGRPWARRYRLRLDTTWERPEPPERGSGHGSRTTDSPAAGSELTLSPHSLVVLDALR